MCALKLLKRVWDNPYFLWLVLSWPSLDLLRDFYENVRYDRELLSVTGIFASQLLVVAMSITPLMHLTNGWSPVRWLAERRRYFGVAAFGYALLHTVFYLRGAGDIENVLLEAIDLELLVGWFAFLILVPLALTSNSASVRTMGLNWKTLQRGVYLAAVFTFAHWVLMGFHVTDAVIWFAPLAALESFRLWKWAARRWGAIT